MVLVSLDYIYIIYILVRVLMRVIFIIFRSLLLYIILCILLSRMEIRTTTGPFVFFVVIVPSFVKIENSKLKSFFVGVLEKTTFKQLLYGHILTS
jgi:hypothetical protein